MDGARLLSRNRAKNWNINVIDIFPINELWNLGLGAMTNFQYFPFSSLEDAYTYMSKAFPEKDQKYIQYFRSALFKIQTNEIE